MPKHRLCPSPSAWYDDIVTPVSRKHPKESIPSSPLNKNEKQEKKVSKKVNGQTKDTSNESCYKAPTEDEDSDIQFITDVSLNNNNKMKTPSTSKIKKSCSSSDSDSDDYCPKHKSGKNKSFSYKMPYSREEDKMIVKYLMQHDRIKKASSIKLWERLEASEENQKRYKRTYQSLKNRFLKQIVPNLLTEFKTLLDERNIKMILEKFPKLKDGMRKRKLEELMQQARNRSGEDSVMKKMRYNDNNSKDNEILGEVQKLERSATSTPLNDIKNRSDIELRRDNNRLLSEFFNNSSENELIIKPEGENLIKKKKKKVVEEVIRIEETSDEEEPYVKSTQELVVCQLRNKNSGKCDVEEETQLQEEPFSFNEVSQLSISENVIPVIVDSQIKPMENSPSQSLLFRNVNNGDLASEKDLGVSEKEKEEPIEKPVVLRKKKRCYKPLYCYSIKHRLLVKQLLLSLLMVKKGKRCAVRMRKLRQDTKSQERSQEEVENFVADEIREDERRLEVGSKNDGDDGVEGDVEDNEDIENDKELGEVIKIVDEYTGGNPIKQEPEEEQEIHVVKITSSNMLDHFSKKALMQYRKLLTDSDSESELPDIEEFVKKLQKYSKRLPLPKKEVISSEDEAPNCQANKLTADCSFKSDDSVNSRRGENSTGEKLNSSNCSNSSNSGLLGNMLNMLSEKEKKRI